MPKSKTNYHAVQRMQERIGIHFNSNDYSSACRAIREGHRVEGCNPIKSIYKQSNSRTHWLVKMWGIPVVAIYDSELDSIATFMPVGWNKSYWSLSN